MSLITSSSSNDARSKKITRSQKQQSIEIASRPDFIDEEDENMTQSAAAHLSAFDDEIRRYEAERTRDLEEPDESRPLTPGEGAMLDETTVTKNLSNLGRTADGTRLVFLELSLPGANLSDIRVISKFKELQVVDLSHNHIRDLSALGELPYLLTINVANNEIERLLDFLPPYNLKEANFAYNKLQEIGNLTNFHYLQTLELNNNKISKIEGLEFCHRLKSLDLAHNMIRKIEGLDNLPLVNLDLRSNQIKRIEGLNTLEYLRHLNLANNQIRSLQGFPDRHDFLETIDLEGNKINNLGDIDYLVNFNLLRELNLSHNELRQVENYKLAVIFKLSKLTMLDRRKVDSMDKVKANNLFKPSAEYLASRDHMTNLMFNFIQSHQVKESTLPSIDSPYPILILCGTEGSGTFEIGRKLADEYPDYFDFVVTHTTRRPKPREKDKYDYNFLTKKEFENEATLGKFICTNEYFGEWYGIQWDSIEAVARQGLACIMTMELEALLSFKQTYFEPRCVLVLTLDNMVQMQRLVTKNIVNQVECETTLTRTDMYAEFNRDHPGFFDAVIVSDDLSEAYSNLRTLVLNYLGVASQDQQNSMQVTQQHNQNLLMQRQLSNLNGSQKPTEAPSQEAYQGGKELDMMRSDSFLPSNTATANRSQSSHMSMDSLSQLYNQSLRLKFGSAPAQLLLGKGEHAERSLEKRVSAIKNHFNLDNLVNTKAQMTKQLASKQINAGQLSNRNNANSSWLKLHDEDGLPTYKSSQLPDSQMKASKKSLDLSLARATVNTNLTSGNMERRLKKDQYDEDDYEYEQPAEELEGEEDLNDEIDDEDDEDDDVIIDSAAKNHRAHAHVMRHHGKKSSTKYPSKRPDPAASSSSSSSANSSSMKILGKIYS